MMKKIICIAVALLMLSACMRPDVIAIHHVEDVRIGSIGSSNARVSLFVDIENKGRSNIVIKEFKLDVHDRNNPKSLLEATVADRVEFRRRSRGIVEIPLTFSSGNGILGMASSLKRIQNHDPALRVSFELKIRKGSISKRIAMENLTIDQCIEALSHVNLDNLEFLKIG